MYRCLTILTSKLFSLSVLYLKKLRVSTASDKSYIFEHWLGYVFLLDRIVKGTFYLLEVGKQQFHFESRDRQSCNVCTVGNTFN